MNDKLVLDFLINQVSLFKLLSNKQLKKIVTGSRVQSYGFNEAVVRFGEDATFYGVLLEGTLSASVVGEGGLRKQIGAYIAAMGGLDVLIFTGGIGQGSAGVRSLALQGL